MKIPAKLLRDSFVGLAILSTGFLMYNMLAIIIFRKQVFLERDTISCAELMMIIGFGLVVLFDIMSLLWIVSGFRYLKEGFAGSKIILFIAVLSIISLFGAKVMVDEIGREYILGWEVIGEWIILYVFLTFHLVYNFLIILKLIRTYNVIWQ